MRNFRVFGFFIVAAIAISGCSNPTSSTEYKSLEGEVDGIQVEVDSLQTEIDSLQNEVDSSDSLAKKLEDLKTERETLIGDLATLLSVPSRRSAAISKFSLPACKTWRYADMDLRAKYDDTNTITYRNELKQLIGASHTAWGLLPSINSDGFPAALNQYIAESNFDECDRTNLNNWFKEKCKTFDRMMLKKDTDSYIGKCLKGSVKISQSDAATGPCAFQGYISGDYDVRAQFGTTLDTATHATDDNCSDAAKKLTEGRTVEFWGYVIGSYTYTTTSNGSQTIPAFKGLAAR